MVLKINLGEREGKFRELAMKRYGYRKGALQKASADIYNNWIREQDGYDKIPKVDDPFKGIEGALKKYRGKITSVELQHETIDWGD